MMKRPPYAPVDLSVLGHSSAADSPLSASDLADTMRKNFVGQPQMISRVLPFIMADAVGLGLENRPVGVFMLLGPTGCGKTHSVETLADALHGSTRHMLRIDCGEFQMEHEVAKLIGAPPGYLGHRETSARLTQTKLISITSQHCNLSIVLFDEIEKAAPSMLRLLLGVLDKGSLRLGDGSEVNFQKSLIFMTSNVGARELTSLMRPLGFAPTSSAPKMRPEAVRKHFHAEFINRVDEQIVFNTLSSSELEAVLDIQLWLLQDRINRRLGVKGFDIQVDAAARRAIIAEGNTLEYGARELKRTLNKRVFFPLIEYMSNNSPSGRTVTFKGKHIRLTVSE